MRQLDGVAAAVAMTWFGGAYEEDGRGSPSRTSPSRPSTSAPSIPTTASIREQLADFQRYRDGAIVGRADDEDATAGRSATASRCESRCGRSISDLRIVGEIPNERAPMLWLNREYLDEALQGAAGQPGSASPASSGCAPTIPSGSNAIMRTVDEHVAQQRGRDRVSETEKSFFSNFFGSLQGFVTIILIVTGLVALCIVFIAANTASMAVRERSGELAVLKAIGFTRRVIFGTLLAEAVVLSDRSPALLGVALAVRPHRRAAAPSAGWNDALGPLGNFIVTGPVIVQGRLPVALRRHARRRRAVAGAPRKAGRADAARGLLMGARSLSPLQLPRNVARAPGAQPA